MNNKTTYIILFLLIALVFVINLVGFKNGHGWGDDFSLYIAQSRSIVNWDFDELISVNKYRIENSPVSTGAILGAWGFPILITPVYYAFGLDMYAMKVYICLFFLLSLIIIFLLFKDRLGNIETLLLVGIIAFNPIFNRFMDNVLTDIPFLFFSLLCLFLIERFVVKRKMWINKLLSYFLLGFLIFFASQIRLIGFVLLPTLLFVQYIENKRSVKIMATDRYNFIPYLIFITLYKLQGWIFPSGSLSHYALADNSLMKVLKLVIEHIKTYALLPSGFFFMRLGMDDFTSNDIIYLLLYGVIMVFVISGIINNIKKDYIFLVYVFFTLFILIISPYMQGYRYIFPIFPFFLYFLFAGVSKASRSFSIPGRLKRLNINMVYLFGLGLLLISIFHISLTTYQSMVFNRTKVLDGPYHVDSVEIFNYIKENTNKYDVIIFPKPRAMTLHTNRRSIRILTVNQLLKSKADYIVYTKKINWWYKFPFTALKNNFKCLIENDSLILCDLKDRLSKRFP